MTKIRRAEIPYYMVFVNYFSRLVLIIFGLLSELFRVKRLQRYNKTEKNRDSYPRLYDRIFYFYLRNITLRYYEKPYLAILCSIAAEKIKILKRHFMKDINEPEVEVINFGSYNYLGYSQKSGSITDSVEDNIRKFGVGVCSTTVELEAIVAKFLGTEDAMVFGMGFATNAYTMSALFGKGCLVISDELNHASIILGCRVTGAKIKVFKHNDMKDLEQLVRNSIIEGQTVTGRAWKKIFVIIEGVYSMEGTIANLPEILRIKKKYKLYLYLDEAHSIGALGKTGRGRGRGICEYFGCNPKDIDILMGTFTKSFAAAGGYITGDRKLIQYMRCRTASFHYGQPMTPPIIQQIISVFKDLCDNQSQSHWRVKQLKKNTVYFREKLIEKGYHIEGSTDSPVVPLMVYSENYLRHLFVELLNSGIATVIVSYPVTSSLGARLRFCLSALHTRSMIDYTIDTIHRIGSKFSLNFSENK